ncbi:MAG: hypothetical protein ABI675_02910 [Chitinophagaceae bacterium]
MALVCLLAISCHKQNFDNRTDQSYLATLKDELSGHLSPEDIQRLDFSHALLSKVDSARLFFLQVPLLTEKDTEFVLLKTNRAGHIEVGKIIQIKQDGPPTPSTRNRVPSFEGSISIKSLSRTIEISSAIKAGVIQAMHLPDSTARAASTPDPYVELPEVIIVCSSPSPSSSDGISWSTWYSVTAMVGSGSGGGGGWYTPAATNTTGGGGTSSGTGHTTTPAGTSNLVKDDLIYIRAETEVNNPAITLVDFINCFNAIPDLGAKCKITIFTDLPVNGDPTKFFDFHSGSPGHTWLRFEKSNSGKNASQHIGFYPATNWKDISTMAPIRGKLVDNGNHEFNASYELTITPAQLQTGLTKMLYLSRFIQYDIDDNNCTDWAINVFNAVVEPEQWLSIDKYDIPGGMAPYGTSTPQGLFTRLQEMLAKGTRGVEVPIVGFSGKSTGPCKVP